jgi:hypothetical protein
MKGLRLSIMSLMAFVMYAAVGLAAFASVNDPYYGRLWDDTYYMVTVFLLAIASMMAILSPERSRARWLGFAVFGWVHLLFGWPDSGGSPQSPGPFRPRFPHTTVINWVLFDFYPPSANFLQALAEIIRPWLARPAHRQWETFLWHNVQTTVTMGTAFVGVFVGSFLGMRVERNRLSAGETDVAATR